MVQATHLAGGTQHRRIQGDEGQNGMDAVSTDDQPNPGTPPGRSVCIQTNHPAPVLCELETGPRCDGMLCLQSGLINARGLCEPSLEPHRQRPSPSPTKAGSDSADRPLWRSEPWYPMALSMVAEVPILLPNKEDLIQPTHRINQPDIIPQLVAWTRATETKAFLEAPPGFMEDQILKIL